jgi:hypothetical protein
VSLISATERFPINPQVFVENLQLFNYVASHWSKPGAICQLEDQKRTDAFIMVFFVTDHSIQGTDGFRRIIHTSQHRNKLRSPTAFRPISVTPILYKVVEKSFVQKWLKPTLLVEALNDQYTISKRDARTAHLTNALIMSLLVFSKMMMSRCLLVDFTSAFDTVDRALVVSKLKD